MARKIPIVAGGATTAAGATAASAITLARPAGVKDGDLLLACLRTNGSSSPTDFALAGWERVGMDFVPSSPGYRVTGIYAHRVTSVAAEPTSYTFTKSVADSRWAGALFAVSGVDVAAPYAGESTATQNIGTALQVDPFPLAGPSLVIVAFGNEVVSPNSSEPATQPGARVALAASSSGTATTRTTLLVSAVDNPSATSIGPISADWGTLSGGAATAVALYGADQEAPPPSSDVKIKMRRGTASQWALKNPVLAQGEPGFDLTNRELRVGDGVSRWADLPTISGGGQQVIVVPDINNIPPGTPAGTILFQAD